MTAVSRFTWESGARSYSRSIPNIFSHGDGFYLVDREGRKHLDFLCGAGVLLLGHNHPAIMDAIRNTAQPLLNHLDLRTEAEEKFANELLPLLPFDCPQEQIKLHFCGPTGGDATEAAVKLAVLKTGRRGVFAFAGSYHGMGQGSLSISSSRHYRDAGLRVNADVTFLHFPYPYRFPAAYGTPEKATEFCVAHLEMMLEDDHSGVGIPAAIIIEPVQGEGGNLVAPPGFLRRLREICDQYGIMLIFDEIQSGLGRCGDWFACEESRVQPDIVCISKGIGGGFPMALIAFPEHMNVWHPADHIGTFRGQQYAMTAGRALLGAIKRDNLLGNVQERHKELWQGLAEIGRESTLIGQVRGRGVYIGVEINKTLPDPGASAQKIKRHMLSRGVVMECGGRNGAVLRLLPPLTITSEICTTFLTAFRDSVKATEKEEGGGLFGLARKSA